MRLQCAQLIFSVFLVELAFASNNSLIELASQQTQLNDEYIQSEIQTEVERGYLSQENLDLIEANQQLQQRLDKLAADLERIKCKERMDKPPKKRPKKKKKGQWVLGAVLEVMPARNDESYAVLASSLDRAELNQMYQAWAEVENFEQLKQLIRTQTADMNDNEFLDYVSFMTGALPYNYEKASFSQQGDTQAVDTLWSMLQEAKQGWVNGRVDNMGGICGDLHFAALMMGEIARPDSYEYFTASYATADAQHVIMFAVDKQSGQAVVINYDEVQQVENPNGVESLLVKNSDKPGDFNNVGGGVRIFANDGGEAKHIASVKTALGSFLYQASVDAHKQFGAPLYNDFSTQSFEATRVTSVVEGESVGADKNQTAKAYNVTQGFKLLKGTRKNGNAGDTDIFTAVYFVEKDQNTNGLGRVTDSNQIGKESSLSVSGSHASLGNLFVDEKVWVLQLNANTNAYKTILRTDKVDIQANARLNLNADYYNIMTSSGERAHSGDGNLETSIGVSGDFKLSDKDQVRTYIGLDQAIGLKEQRQIFDWGHLPKNIRLTQNALRVGGSYSRRLGAKDKTAHLSGQYIGTQVGGRYQIQTTLAQKKSYVFINYQDDAIGINPAIKSNLLPMNGRRVSGGYGANALAVGRHMLLDLGAQVTYFPQIKGYFVGADFKLKLRPKKK